MLKIILFSNEFSLKKLQNKFGNNEKDKFMYNFFKYVSYILVLVGALNWGLVGAFDFDLVAALFGVDSLLTNITYILVGISAIVSFITVMMHNKEHQTC